MTDDDLPDLPFDPDDLPPELRQLFEQIGPAIEHLQSSGGLEEILKGLGGGGIAGFGGLGVPGGLGGLLGTGRGTTGPVNWELAARVAREIAEREDRAPTPDEEAIAERAWALAEHWLDEGPLPSPSVAGSLVVASRRRWVDAALESMRPLVEPVAAANTRAMADLAAEQMRDFDPGAMLGELGIGDGDAVPGLTEMLGQLGGMDASSIGDVLRPMGAWLTGMQVGQVVGTLSTQLLGQYDLGIPLAPRHDCYQLAVNVTATFGGYDLDADEVAVALALAEAAHRRLYAALPWLEAHIQGLVAQFANGIEVDAQALADMAQELMADVDVDDPESLRRAQAKAAEFRITPTDAQRRVLQRLQVVVALTGAWARAEARRVATRRLPNYGRVEEVLRRRRAVAGDGEQLLANLLGLDLRPSDESLGDLFVAHVESAAGPARLRQALEHPETLPSAEELADPAAWLARMDAEEADGDELDDSLTALLDGTLGDAPVERSAAERLVDPEAE